MKAIREAIREAIRSREKVPVLDARGWGEGQSLAAGALGEMGYTNVATMEGGPSAWGESDYEVE